MIIDTVKKNIIINTIAEEHDQLLRYRDFVSTENYLICLKQWTFQKNLSEWNSYLCSMKIAKSKSEAYTFVVILVLSWNCINPVCDKLKTNILVQIA